MHPNKTQSTTRFREAPKDINGIICHHHTKPSLISSPMAGRSYLSKPHHRLLSGDRQYPTPNSDVVEFDEAEIWNSHLQQQSEFKNQIHSLRTSKKPMKRAENGDRTTAAAASSLPVNIPDWSKILRDDYKDSRRKEYEGESDYEEAEEVRIPPHEFLAKQLARTRIASFSLHEGIGRTLKGRDLSRVRNAIWQKTGFED